jgi:hypothetical protein
MKTAGDIISALFDEGFIKKAKGYSKFFESWVDITAKNGIAAAADHSRIKDLDRGIILIEMDHPGWKQILQTKQSKLLNDFRYRFPELGISGISLMLGSREPSNNVQEDIPQKEEREINTTAIPAEPAVTGLDAIKDEEFKETLKNIGQNIAARETR